MSRFTKALRQQIIEDFSRRNNGWFDPKAFVAYVGETGPDHPAYDWFTWDDVAAASAYRVDQARDFARGLKVTFKVEEVQHGPVNVVSREVPFLTSPKATRKGGGGYYLTDPNDAEHMAELAREAASTLRWFIGRYEAAILHVGGDADALTALQLRLEGVEAAQAA